MVAGEVDEFSIEPKDRAELPGTKTLGVLGDHVEDRLDVGRRAADDAQDLARRRLLLERSVSPALASARSRAFVGSSEPHVFAGWIPGFPDSGRCDRSQ